MITHNDPSSEPPIDVTDRLRFNVPNALCAIRLAGSLLLVPLVLLGDPVLFLGVFLLLASTDLIDGKLAIWLNQRTTFGARFDSIADAAMYGALLFGCIWLKGDAIAAEAPWIVAALGCYTVSCLTALIKFRRLPSHHTYSAKTAWLITVAAAVALMSGWASWPLRVAAVAVALGNLESTSITLLSDRWQADVPTVWRVIRQYWLGRVSHSSPTTRYEENLEPLSNGDFAKVFADHLAAIQHAQENPPERITPAKVVQWSHTDIQPYLGKICRRLLLPGSGILGLKNLAELKQLAIAGHSCILCLNHRSNLDVPTLYALLQDRDRSDLFDRIIWISGRKLDEDVGPTRMLVQAFSRVIVTPRSWMKDAHSDEELHEAHQINVASHRAIHELRNQGWVFALFPTATRIRPGDESTTHAIEETDSYLKNFEFMLLGRIDGCTLPVSRDRDLTHEVPTRDRMRYTFGPVLRADEWRANATRRFAELDQRTASAQAIIEDIAAIRSGEADER
jgi:CDP-diacylglycerol--glycerol-3-phosphate 3-phosphatidyltransferase